MPGTTSSALGRRFGPPAFLIAFGVTLTVVGVASAPLAAFQR